MAERVSRRVVVGMLGAGIVGAPTLAEALDAASSPGSGVVDTLVAPLRVGSRLARWTVRAIGPLSSGAATVMLADAAGRSFEVEILARDDSARAAKPPAVTARLAVFVRNEGDGASATHEEDGLAAMALAEILARNEEHVDLTGFLTHAERIERHRAQILTHRRVRSAR